MTTKQPLSDRVEALTGPEREIDVLCHEAFDRPFRMEYFDDTCTKPSRNLSYVPCYTASLDAAMTLVPEGWWLQHLGQCLGGWRVRIETNGPPSKSIGIGFGVEQPATPALALTAAALKAREL